MEDAGSKCRIGMSQREDIPEILLASCSARGYDRDGQGVGKACKCLVGKAMLYAVVVHAGEENLARTALVNLMCPFEESPVRRNATSVEVAMPSVGIELGINGHHTYLAAEMGCYLVYECRTAQSRTINADLVCSGKQHPLYVMQLANASTYGKGDADLLRHASHHVGKGLASLVAGCYVKVYQFVRPLFAVSPAKGYGVACLPKVDEIHALYGLSVLNVEAWYYALG